MSQFPSDEEALVQEIRHLTASLARLSTGMEHATRVVGESLAEVAGTRSQMVDSSAAAFRYQRALVRWTIVLSVATITYAAAALFQWGVMRSQLAEMQSGSSDTRILAEAAKTQADNTGKLATAAIDQVKQLEASVEALQDNAKASTQIAINGEKGITVAERQTRISLRAWVVPARTEFSQFEVGKVVKVQVEFRNNGRTPAINLTTNGKAEWFLISTPRPPPKPFLQRESLGKATIRSEGGMLLAFDLPLLTEATLQQIQSGQRTIRVHGKAWYEDVFNHNHWMSFCREYDHFSEGFVACDVEGEQIDSDPE